jgi:hypothetical protein
MGKRIDFTPAEKALIKKAHGFMPPNKLLELINDRRLADLGHGVEPYTADQLHDAIKALGGQADQPATTWAGLRKVIAHARHSGLLAKIDKQLIDDFGVVYQLNAKQVLVLKDILLAQNEDVEAA